MTSKRRSIKKKGHARRSDRKRARNLQKQGHAIDSSTAEIRNHLTKLKAEETRVEKLGARQLNGPHFKTGTGRMFFLAPAKSGGYREHVYVGVDPDQQAKFLSMQHRWDILRQLRIHILAQEIHLHHIERQGKDLLYETKHRLQGIQAEVRKLVKPREKYEVTPGSCRIRTGVTRDDRQLQLDGLDADE